MKKILAILAIAAVLAVSGCNSGNNAGETTTAAESTAKASDPEAKADTKETKKSGEVTEVAFETPDVEDTTDEALEFLDTAAKPFRKYLDVRRSIPLTFETTVTNGGQEWKTGIYIKDKNNFVQYSKDPDGNVTKVIYKKDKAYQVDDATKMIYVSKCGKDNVKNYFNTVSLRYLYADEVSKCTYEVGEKEYEGTNYEFVNIISGDDVTTHYFDIDTGALKYTVSGNTVTRVDKLENSFSDESIFELPADYESMSFNDYYKQLEEEAKAKQQNAIDIESE